LALSKEKLWNVGLLWLRVLMGCGIASHGFTKIFGDLGGNMHDFAIGVGRLGFPAPLAFAWAAALSEFVGGILCVVGFKTRFAAAAIFITMTTAAFVRHGGDPFSTRELALAYWTMSGALILTGSGNYSLKED